MAASSASRRCWGGSSAPIVLELYIDQRLKGSHGRPPVRSSGKAARPFKANSSIRQMQARGARIMPAGAGFDFNPHSAQEARGAFDWLSLVAGCVPVRECGFSFNPHSGLLRPCSQGA